jgi:hypothetical protein
MDIDDFTKKSASRKKNSERMRIRRLPPNMIKLETHKLLKDTIKLNELQDKLLNTPEYNEILNDTIKNINLIFEEAKRLNPAIDYNYFIAGSRAWNRFFKDFYDLDIISPYEKSSIHNINADLYYFINDKTLIDGNIKADIKELLKQTIEPLVDAIRKYSDLEDNTKNVYITIEEDECLKDNKSLITSKRLFLKLHIDDSVPTKKPAKQSKAHHPFKKQSSQQSSQPSQQPAAKVLTASEKAAKKAAKKAAQLAAEIAAKEEAERKKSEDISNRSARLARRSKPLYGGGTIESFSKVILSVDLYYSVTSTVAQDILIVKNISNIIERDEINSLNYLNLFGLYIFLQLGIKKIFVPKGYNIFKIREIIFDKLVLFGDYRTPTLKKIVEQYNATFINTTLFDNFFYTDLQKIYALSYEPIATIINNMEVNIIETLRCYINKTMININKEVRELKPEIGLFVVGGDALRRYKNDISVTKDIDCKIYVPKVLITPTNDLINKLNSIIVSELLKLVCYLIENSDRIFTKVISSYETDLYKIDYELINDDPNIKNFRYRQIFKNPFPVDLYSLDYRCKINVEVKDNINPDMNTKFFYNYDIAFLDVVLEILDIAPTFYNENAIISNDIPISRLEFLLKDLKNTYNSDTSSLLRFIGGKITKDYVRYNTLLELIKENKFKYSSDPLKMEILISPEDENLYISSYRPIKEGESADNLSLPVLFEKNVKDDKIIYDRYELDLIYNYDETSTDFHQFYSSKYYKIGIIKRKKMYSFNINDLSKLAGGTKLDTILEHTMKEIDELKLAEKSLCESYNYNNDDISDDIINDIVSKRIMSEADIESINRDNYVNNYVLNIMTPLNETLSLNDEKKTKKFYNKIMAIIETKKGKEKRS